MTKKKHPSNKWERLQVEKKYREKEVGDKPRRIRNKFTQEKQEEDHDFATLGYGAVPEQRAQLCGTVSVCDPSTAS